MEYEMFLGIRFNIIDNITTAVIIIAIIGTI